MVFSSSGAHHGAAGTPPAEATAATVLWRLLELLSCPCSSPLPTRTPAWGLPTSPPSLALPSGARCGRSPGLCNDVPGWSVGGYIPRSCLCACLHVCAPVCVHVPVHLCVPKHVSICVCLCACVWGLSCLPALGAKQCLGSGQLGYPDVPGPQARPSWQEFGHK